jgi:hypothetical protein
MVPGLCACGAEFHSIMLRQHPSGLVDTGNAEAAGLDSRLWGSACADLVWFTWEPYCTVPSLSHWQCHSLVNSPHSIECH